MRRNSSRIEAIIECESLEMGLVDLHNCCDVRGLAFAHTDDRMVIEISFREIERKLDFVLRFKQVDLEKIEVQHHNIGDLTVFHGLDHYTSPGEALPDFEVDLASMSVKFRAAYVKMEVMERRAG